MIRVLIPGTHGKSKGGNRPTSGILGRLGGLGARPAQIGFVSDGDGALVALAVAAKLLDMQNKGDYLDAILCVDTTKGNRIINHKGFAISPTVKEGYILKTSEDLLDIMEITTGRLPQGPAA